MLVVLRAQPASKEGAQYEVNAYFVADLSVQTAEVDSLLLRLLEWSRADAFAPAHSLSEHDLMRQVPGERCSLRGVVQHVGIAEWRYLDSLHLAAPPA